MQYDFKRPEPLENIEGKKTKECILLALEKRPGISVQYIGEMIARSDGNVRNALHNLIREGRVERIVDGATFYRVAESAACEKIPATAL